MKYLMGSTYFFNMYTNFVSKDIDYIQIIENDNTMPFAHIRQISGQGECLFLLKKQNHVNEYINYALQQRQGMVLGKFLIPEFNQVIGLTIQDLPKLQPLIDKLDFKHKYEKIIYESYLQNQAFTLTKEQRDKAYQCYRASREV